MAASFLALCAAALLVNTISGQCIGNIGNIGSFGYSNALAGAQLAGYGGCGGYGLGLAPSISASGGGLAISSASPIYPNGVSVVSENAIEGALEVAGQLPLLAAVAFEGAFPSAGAAGVSYSCGNGQVGIPGESLAAAGYGAARAGIANAGLVGARLANAPIAQLAASPCGCSRALY